MHTTAQHTRETKPHDHQSDGNKVNFYTALYTCSTYVSDVVMRSEGTEPDRPLFPNSNEANWTTADTLAGNVPTSRLLLNDNAVIDVNATIDDGSVPAIKGRQIHH